MQKVDSIIQHENRNLRMAGWSVTLDKEWNRYLTCAPPQDLSTVGGINGKYDIVLNTHFKRIFNFQSPSSTFMYLRNKSTYP